MSREKSTKPQKSKGSPRGTSKGSPKGVPETTEAIAVEAPRVTGKRGRTPGQSNLLSQQRQEQLVQMHLEGHTVTAIAQALGITAGSVSMRINKMRAQWRDEFERERPNALAERIAQARLVQSEAWALHKRLLSTPNPSPKALSMAFNALRLQCELEGHLPARVAERAEAKLNSELDLLLDVVQRAVTPVVFDQILGAIASHASEGIPDDAKKAVVSVEAIASVLDRVHAIPSGEPDAMPLDSQ